MVNYSFVIRRATIDDAPAIKEVMDDSFELYKMKIALDGKLDVLNETIDDIKKDINTIDVFIALIDNVPVGSIRVKQINQDEAYISRFGVKQSYHNIGIGKSMMNLVDKMLESKNIKRASLNTASKYAGLMRFYYGRGFYVSSTSQERGYIRALMVKDYVFPL